MSITQNAYNENIDNYTIGQVGDTSTTDIDTFTLEDAKMEFGVAVERGTTDNQCKRGLSAANKYIGVAIKDPTVDALNDDKYVKGNHVPVMFRGTVCVQVASAVSQGDDATAKTTTGAISSTAASSTNIKLTGAKFITSAAAGGKALLRLDGSLPTA